MIEILKFEMISKGPLIAKFNVKMHKWGGLIIKGCSLFDSNGKKWISMPSQQYESEGKKKYFPYISYENKDIDQKFRDTILLAANEYLEKMKPMNSNQNLDQGEFPF